MLTRTILLTLLSTSLMLWSCDDGGTKAADPVCGNGVVETGELCDGADFAGMTCASYGQPEGELACTDQCTMDLSGCRELDVCGDGIRDAGEACEDDDFGDMTCASFGMDGGDLVCTVECTIDAAGCHDLDVCGNGIMETGEACDGEDFGTFTCASFGFDEGTLTCAEACTIDTSACTYEEPECGNSIKEMGEVCDAGDLDEQTCLSLGYYGGVLECANDCMSFAIADCESAGRCGDDEVQSSWGEACDGTDMAGQSCETLGYAGGTLACGLNCQSFDDTLCLSLQIENDDTLCADTVDNDADGLIDCADPSCAGYPDTTVCIETNCTDGVDNDSNGLTDCNDRDCSNNPACAGDFEQNCTDGTDNDGDAYVDCNDFDCADETICIETLCDDTVDNDGDGHVDCEDFDCLYTAANCAVGKELTDATCSDGLDQDGNTFIDCRDFSCLKSPLVTVCEGNPVTCADGLDNDHNGVTDCADIACRYCHATDPTRDRVVSTCPRCVH